MQQNNGQTVMVQGRIVWTSGDLFKGRPKLDMTTKLQKMNKLGQPIQEYGFGLSIPKTAFSQPGGAMDLWNAIHAEAFTLFPNRQIPPSFAMKFKDGDLIDDKGVPFAQREGYAGSLVFACTTTLPIKFFKFENGQNIMIDQGIKCGDYVNVQLQIKAHPAFGTGKAGLYVNPNAVQFLGYGKEIINTPSGDQIFGVAQPGLPAGASAMPIAQPGMLMPTSAPPAQSPPQAQAHYGVLPPIHQPPPGGQPMGNGYAAPPAAGPPGVFPQGQVPNGFAQPAYPGNPMGNAPQPGGYPAPAVNATPMAAPMPPSTAMTAAPWQPGQ